MEHRQIFHLVGLEIWTSDILVTGPMLLTVRLPVAQYDKSSLLIISIMIISIIILTISVDQQFDEKHTNSLRLDSALHIVINMNSIFECLRKGK